MSRPNPSDMTGDQWAILDPLVPVSALGRPRDVEIRDLLNAIFYQARSGCRWDMLPHDFPPKSTVFDHFDPWRDDGTRQMLLDSLRQHGLCTAGRYPSPGAGSIDSQTVKGTEVGGDRGYDGGKKLRGRKRHTVVDSWAWSWVLVTAASVDDGTTAPRVLGRLTAEHRSRLGKVWADGGYQNHSLDAWHERSKTRDVIEVASCPAGAKGFVLLHRRLVMERTFPWIGRYRRNSRE